MEFAVPAVGLLLDPTDVRRHDDRKTIFFALFSLVHLFVVLLALDAHAPADALGDGAGGNLGLGLADVGRAVEFFCRGFSRLACFDA